MNTTPLLLAGAIAFWGWQTGQWAVALGVAAAIELPRIVERRRDFGLRDFNRASDFCALLAAASFVYFYLAFGNPRAIVLLFQWLPVALLPLALAQAWGSAQEIPLSVLFRNLRARPSRRETKLNLGYPYFAIWLLAASAANVRDNRFYLGLLVLIAWPLVLRRPRSFHPALWVLAFSAAAIAGFGGHIGLNHLQLWLEGAAPEWLAGGGTRTDPYRSMTDIGSIGELKLSDSIVLRVQADANQKTPILLHRASYDSYGAGTWIARHKAFRPVARGAAPGDWILQPGNPAQALTIHDSARDGNPVLALPIGTVRIDGLPASGMKQNALGAVQAEVAPGYVRYVAGVDASASPEDGASPEDLKLPATESAVVQEVADRLGLKRMEPEQALQSLKRYFSGQFSYATYQKRPPAGRTALAEFLLSTHAGHCEFFATATVLLARAAGIPARYATGYSAMEYSALEKAYLVRDRHAHAWARVHVNGRWIDVDTTPPTWSEIEAARGSAWARLADAVSWARFSIARWLASDNETLYLTAAWAAGLACLWLAWRLLPRMNPEKAASGETPSGTSGQGADSEFYRVQRRVAELGWQRNRAEPILDWLSRIDEHRQLEPHALAQLASLHYRYRFDPVGLDDAQRTALRERSLEWLARHPRG